MPVATTTAIALGVSAAATAASTASSLHQAHKGKERARRASRELDAYQRQDLQNVYADLQVPTEGFDLRRQQIQQTVANQTESLSRAGARGLIGGLPQAQAYSEEAFTRLGADINQSMFRIQELIAQDEARIRDLQERREQQDIAGLGAEIQAGRQQAAAGRQQAIGALSQFAGQTVGALTGPGGLSGGAGAGTTYAPGSVSPVQGFSLPQQPLQAGGGGVPPSAIPGSIGGPIANPYGTGVPGNIIR